MGQIGTFRPGSHNPLPDRGGSANSVYETERGERTEGVYRSINLRFFVHQSPKSPIEHDNRKELVAIHCMNHLVMLYYQGNWPKSRCCQHAGLEQLGDRLGLTVIAGSGAGGLVKGERAGRAHQGLEQFPLPGNIKLTINSEGRAARARG